MAEILRIEHLTGGYDIPLYQDFSLSLGKGGRIITILGPNGCGKSTLLKFLYRELPYQGTIFLDGKNLASYSQRELARALSLVPQNGRIDYDFTVQEAVSMSAHDAASIQNVLQLCHLADKKDASVQALSGGEFQRTLIARALAQDSPLMLLDEPVSNLDIATQIEVMRLFRLLARQGKTILCVLHDLLLAQVYSDEVILLKDGKLISQGSVAQVLTEEHITQVYGIQTCMMTEESGTRRLLCPLW